MGKVVNTPKGTALPLTNLKGKDYLMVAYRIQWFNEEVPNFNIESNFLLLTENETIAHVTVTIADKDGRPVKRASATKRETKQDFSDHTEKAETSAVGRALAMLGYGTQFAVADLDEGTRLADSPLEAPKAEGGTVSRPSFRKAVKKEVSNAITAPTNSGVTATQTTNGAGNTATPDTGWE